MINTLTRPAARPGAPASQSASAGSGDGGGGGGGGHRGYSGARRRAGGRLWVLLNAQALLSGAIAGPAGGEDDRRRLAGGRAL